MKRTVEIRQEGEQLHGVIATEGRAASAGRREVFTVNSIEWPSNGVGILTEHHGTPEVRAFPVRGERGEVEIRTDANEAIKAAIRGGKRFMSVEFHALEERTTAGGVREILRAFVPDVALTDKPEYDTTRAEVREREDASWMALL